MPISRDEVKQIALSVISSGMRISGEGVSGSGLSWSYARPAAAQDPDAETPPPQYDQGDDKPPSGVTPCCLYPWPGVDGSGMGGAPFYPSTDLPMTLFYAGVTFTFSFAYQYSGDPGIPGVSWTLWAGVDPFVGSWGIVTGSGDYVAGPYDCLINTDVTDDFTDIYTADGDTITRDTVCTWSGAKTGGGDWFLDYGLTTAYKWHLSSTGPTPTSDDKTDPQDKPDGAYGAETVA